MKTPEGAEYKRNLQRIKPLVTEAAADAGYSAELERNPPEPAPDPQLTDQPNPGDTHTGVTVTCTPRRSGRLSQPPKALADYMYLIEHLNSLFTLLSAVPVNFVFIEHFIHPLFTVLALDLNLFCVSMAGC